MKKVKNTYEKGILTFFVYPTVEGTYVTACEELCLVNEGKDLELMKLKILADAKKYLNNVSKNKLGVHLLNQSLPDEIKEEFFDYCKKKGNDEFEKWNASIEKLKMKRNLKLLIA
jgi:hypothetical protein